jgi:hypothetical protein
MNIKERILMYEKTKDETLLPALIEEGVEIDLVYDDEGGTIRFTFEDETVKKIYFSDYTKEWIDKMEECGVEIWD